MPYATIVDVEAKWRPLAAVADQAKATALLADAHALLNRELPGLAADVVSGAVDPLLARKVVTDAVIRVLANPAGVSMQTVGPESVQFAGVRTLGSVAFTPAEIDSLQPVPDDDDTASIDGYALGSASLNHPWLPIGSQS